MKQMSKTPILDIINKMKTELTAQDAEMKSQGMTHRLTFTHHKNGGDDVTGDLYTGGDPSKILNQVKGWSIKDMRSAKRGAKQRSTKQILDVAIKSKGDYCIVLL